MAASQPSVIGHRGCAAHAPENTLGGFGRAAELGCDWDEFDVQISRDGVPVVVHDPNLERTTRFEVFDDVIHVRAACAHIEGV